MVDSNLLWKPLLEAAAQTLVGALGSLAVGKLITGIREKNIYVGAMDLWCRGIRDEQIFENSNLLFDGII
ncbi:MAG: hypothetical protein NTX65_05110 [Ignavibacteriales bacterium]|nr:hypothetical protein [Ignavibacteriales bacterium]